MKKILLAVDDSTSAENACDYLMTMATPDDEIFVLAVAPTTTTFMSISFTDPSAAEKVDQQVESHMKELLRKFSKKLVMKGLRHSCLLGHGSVKETILEEATYHHIDLIVLGRRKMSGLKRTLVGSVSSYVVANAPCSVLVVKSDVEHEEKEQKKTQIVNVH